MSFSDLDLPGLEDFVPGALDEGSEERPRTRGECVDGPRPCPWVSCAHHLLLDVARDGALILNAAWRRSGTSAVSRSGDERAVDALDVLRETCALDVADRGGATKGEVARYLGVSTERVRQIQVRAVRKLKGQP